MIYRQLVTDKEEQTKVNTITFLSLMAALVWMIVTDHVSFVPPWTTIDVSFLNALKWMIFIKYLLGIFFVLMIFIPTIVTGYKKESKRNRKIILAIIAGTILILGGLVALQGDNVRRGFFETPVVAEHVVKEKNYSRRGKTHTLYFEDGSFAHVSSNQHKKIAPDDQVYVVYVADVAVAAFRAEEYSLAL
ncbi:MAG: hypothetical protein J5778_02065 [Clostridiales bacterium]|nr:hypothetical protein [Clostridiales bacterium]